LRSDVLRKLRFGAEPESPLPPEAYTRQINAQVYRDLCTRAATALGAGYSAVIDAVALREEERHAFAAVAATAGVAFTGLWLDAPDASGEVLARQLSLDAGAIEWIRINAGGAPDATLATARRAMLH
jgi:hypothetical protein